MKTKTTLAALLLAAVFTLQTQAFGMDLGRVPKPTPETRAAQIMTQSNERIAAKIAQQMMFLSGAIVIASLVGAGTVVLTKTSFLNNRL